MSTSVRTAPTEMRVLEVQHELVAVPIARRQLAADLSARTVAEEVRDEVLIVVSELLGNAVRHGRPLSDGTIRLQWQVEDGQIRLEVTDGGGPGTVESTRGGTWATSGRGLRIVRAMSRAWGVRETPPDGRTVWAAVADAQPTTP